MKQALRVLLVIIFPAFCCASLFAQKQGQAAIDSMLKELSKAKEDTNKVKLLCGLSASYATVNPENGMNYGQKGLALAEQLKWEKGKALAYNSLGTVCRIRLDFEKALGYYFAAMKINEGIGYKEGIAAVLKNISSVYMEQSDFHKALEYYFKELKMEEETGNKLGQAIATGNIGLAYFNISDYPKSVEFDQKALKISEDIGDKYGIAMMIWNIGDVYKHQANFPVAMDNFLKAYKLFEEMGDKKSVADISGNIGSVFESEGDTTKAMEYFLRSLQMSEETGDKYEIALSTQNLGNAYALHNEYSKALEYLFKSLKLFEDTKDKNGVLSVSQNIGSVYTLQHNYVTAIEYLQRSLQMAVEVGDKSQQAAGLSNIGSAFLDLYNDSASLFNNIRGNKELPSGKYKPNGEIPAGKTARLAMAIDYLERSVALAREIQDPELLQAGYGILAEAYKLKGDYKKSLEYYKNHTHVKDSVFSAQNAEKIARLGMQNEYDKKAEEVKKAADLKLLRQRTYTYIGIAGILLLASFSFFIVKERGKSETERKKSDELLLNILPGEVAKELKTNGSTTAKHYDNVTVLFTDFVNFTNAGERMSPQGLIDELHSCFKAFDEITGRYKIEKIKTIGDAYLAVAGLPVADPIHAEHIVKAAIEINAFMQDRVAKLGERTFQIRIGIHSGSVVAGIVGVKKFAYDIWGDTVNTAARMEQNSEPGRINISETTYELVKDKFTCEYRGEIDAKNKGMLKMYFVS